MSEKILAFLKNFAAQSGEYSVVICAALLSALFLVFLPLAAFKKGFDGKCRGKFYALALVFAGYLAALWALGGLNGGLFCSSAFLYLFYSFVLFVLPEKTDKKPEARAATEEERELARFIDKKVKEATKDSAPEPNAFDRTLREERPVPQERPRAERAERGYYTDRAPYGESGRNAPRSFEDVPLSDIEKERVEAPERGRENDFDLDFSHVKNVIARLDYFGLSQSDRRQIHDLEAGLAEAERGENTPEVRDRINDGLSSLLKIMSKYGA